MLMKLNINADGRVINFGIPRGVYLNRLGVSLIAMRKDVPFSPRQARKALREVRKVMKEHDIPSIVRIEVDTDGTKVIIDEV